MELIRTTEQIVNAELMQRFILYTDVSQKSLQTYQRALKQFLGYLSTNGIKSPQRDDIIAYRNYLADNYTANTVASYLSAVKQLFKWASTENLYPDVSAHIKSANTDKGFKKDYLTSNQIKRVLANIDQSELNGLRDYALISLLTTTGLRTIEVHRADIEDCRTLGDGTVLYIQGKGKQDKTDFVKIQPEVENALANYLKARGSASKDEPLFTSHSNNSKGKRLSTRTISGIVKTRFRAVGLDSERLTAHSLRHTAVTLSLLNGNSLQETQQFARHSNLNTTLIYSHNLEKQNNHCGESIANAIF